MIPLLPIATRPGSPAASASASSSAGVDAAPPAAAAAKVAGLYVVSRRLDGSAKALDDTIYALDSVDGVHTQLPWSALEPTEGKFDWSTLDAELKRAVTHSKRVVISVLAGDATPKWVFGAGAKKLEFDVARQVGKGAATRQKIAIAAPWDPAFQAEWKKLVSALSAHIREVPGAYERLAIVKMTGIGELSSETRLPGGQAGKSQGKELADTLKKWKEAGYRPSKVVLAYRTIAGELAAAFPDKALGLEVLESGGFPPIDESGEISKPSEPTEDAVTRDIILWSAEAYKGRFVLSSNGLRASAPESVVFKAGKAGVFIGFQTNDWLWAKNQHGAGCGSEDGETAKECTEDDFAKLLGRGLALGGRTIEVFPFDAVTFPKAMMAVHEKLGDAR